MKKTICVVLILMALFILSAAPLYADGHGGGHGHGGHGSHGHGSFSGGVWIGPGWGGWGWGGWGPWWWGAGYYPYYYPYYTPYDYPEEPSVYVEPAPSEEEQYYWYFCPDSRNYYPYVKQCPSGWLRVVPQTPQDWRE